MTDDGIDSALQFNLYTYLFLIKNIDPKINFKR